MGAGKLTKMGGPRYRGPQWYRASGDVAGLVPGRRTVEKLEIKHPVGALPDLSLFPDLRELEFRDLRGTDLSPLADAKDLKSLMVWGASDVDLTPLSGLGLRWLSLMALDDSVGVPEPFSLGSSMVSFEMVQDGHGAVSGGPIERLVAAIDWGEVAPSLTSLSLQAGGNSRVPPARVDWSFVSLLSNLTWLDVHEGVWPVDGSVSPLEPPFDGLSKKLDFVRIDGWEPDVVQPQLKAYLPNARVASVFDRYEYTGPVYPWRLLPPTEDEPQWQMNGSIADAMEENHPDKFFETEGEAMTFASELLVAADLELARRLGYDRDSREIDFFADDPGDLRRAREILRLPVPPDEDA